MGAKKSVNIDELMVRKKGREGGSRKIFKR